MTQAVVPEPRVEAAIAAVAARCLRSATRFDPDVPFALLGIDSLGTIEMAAALEESLQCDLPAELLASCRDARTLAIRITQLRESAGGVPPHDPVREMLADAVLPDDVRPPGGVERPTDLRTAKRILLTGATGFLGGALLEELLASFEGKIVCLVRDASPDRGGRAARSGHGLAAAAARDRVSVLTGDLSEPRLGLTAARFTRLAGEIDSIVHCGAMVNWVYPYSGLRAANVFGTLELLRLAAIRGVPFHFMSSLSVCYATSGPQTADEMFDGLPHVRGVQLGYAQSKIVAEALVREAARRGLPARIYRPALISGHSISGVYNRDDLISALVRGCVRMETAPDLDWTLDCQPVDFVARAVVRLSGAPGPVFHLGHPRPRHWRECVLWMRMYGYPLRLVPYHTWLRQLDRETGPGAKHASTHPLRPLRTFFLDRQPGSRLTLPELYEESRRTQAYSASTLSLLAASDLASPALDASLLDTYFAAFRSNGALPAPCGAASATRSVHALTLDRDFLSELLGCDVRRVRVLDTGSDHSIVSELTAWRSGRTSGLFRVSVELADGSFRRLRLKAKAADTDVIAVGESLAAIVDASLGDAYARWGHRLGFGLSHHREIEIYRQTDDRFVSHAPALLGSILDDRRGAWILALEDVATAVLRDSADDPAAWATTHIERALDGLAALHAIWYGREAELRSRMWIGHVQSAAGMAEMSDLWTALARHAAPAFSSWGHPDMRAIQQQLIASIERWWMRLQRGPRTLIHNDFNPRNVCLRGYGARLVAYDWELATIGAPQRDLAEFLCFVLTPDAPSDHLRRWIEYYRVALERETGDAVDVDTWQRGFQAGLYDLLLNRLAIYAVVHRVRRQPFLPRVVRTWHRLYELTREHDV